MQHTISQYAPTHEPAYLANGVIGLRLGAFPLPGGSALLNGFVGIHEQNAMEAYAPAPYPLGGDLQLNGTWLSQRPDLLVFDSQTYDFSCGELLSRADFTVDGVTAHLEILTFCSRSLPMVALQEIRISVDHPCRLVMRSLINPAGLPGRLLQRNMPKGIADAVLHWEAPGALSTCGAGFVTEFSGDDTVTTRRNDWGYENDQVLKDYAVDAQSGRQYTLRQYGCLVPSLQHAEPHWQAMRLLGLATWQGFVKLREDNRAAWQELWKGRIVLQGADPTWQQVLDAAFFYLHSTAHASSPCSVAPFGLAQRNFYLGHVFWDTETFMFPSVLLTAPSAARAMLDYRSRLLPQARCNAAMNGYRGVQFPWQSGNHGGEVSDVWARNGITEQHINLDVAFAFAQYVYATGDEIFMRQQAWPVLEGVAEWIVSRVTRTSRGYEIRHITGPDEGIDNIHNNAYTNMAAIVVLRAATTLARRLGFTPPRSWEVVAHGLYLPIDPQTGVMLKHDTYTYTGGMLVPETLGGFFPLTYSHSTAVDQATIRYYLEHARTYLGMPLYSALLGVYAARLGERALAEELLHGGIFPFVVYPFMQFAEYNTTLVPSWQSTGGATCLTNPAGFLMACLYGLPGIQLGPEEPAQWAKFPVTLPAGWESIEVERIWVRGCPAHLSARHGAERAVLEILDEGTEL